MEKYKAPQAGSHRVAQTTHKPSLSLEEALRSAAWALYEVRKNLATLQGWLTAGEASGPYAHKILAEDILQGVAKATQLAHLFADPQAYEVSVSAFLERARLQAGEFAERSW